MGIYKDECGNCANCGNYEDEFDMTCDECSNGICDLCFDDICNLYFMDCGLLCRECYCNMDNIIMTYIVVLKVSRKNKDYAKLLATNNPIKHRSNGSIVYMKDSDPWLDFDNVDVLELIELMTYIDNINKKNKIFEVKIRNNNEYM
eukprot:gene10694-3315_t